MKNEPVVIRAYYVPVFEEIAGKVVQALPPRIAGAGPEGSTPAGNPEEPDRLAPGRGPETAPGEDVG